MSLKALLLLSLSMLLCPRMVSSPPQRKILAIGDVHRRNYQHDAVSHALSTIERLGRETGLYQTYIRTDIQLLTKQPLEFAEKSAVARQITRT